MATLIGSDGSTLWLVLLLVALAGGLATALHAATRAEPAPVRVRAQRTDPRRRPGPRR